jgi:adenosine kinase
MSFGLDLKLCGEMGSQAAAYCLETDGPQSHMYTVKEFIDRFRTNFDDQGKLDILLK